ENIGYLWLILEPALLCVMVALIHSKGPTHFGSDMKPIPFALTGYCVFVMFRGIFTRAEGALETNLPLLYHRNISIFDVLLSRALLEAASAFFAFVFLMSMAVAAGFANPPERPLILLLGYVLMLLLSFGVGMIVCALTYENRSFGRLVHPIGYILLPLSGVFYAMQWLPNSYVDVFYWMPLAHVIELTRHGQFRSAELDFVDPLYLGVWILGSLFLGLLSISVLRGKIHMS
ncbi:MAG TPA: ABC transporter permease, partial [Sphingomonas sp.]